MQITADVSSLARFGNIVGALGPKVPAGVARAINHTAGKARTLMARELVKQTGLKYGTMRRALKFEPASAGNLAASITSRGGDIGLKHFAPKEGGGGVTARPHGQRAFYKGAFLTSGPKGRRAMSLKLGGHVWVNIAGGRWAGQIQKARSGVIIPEEMIAGASADAFFTIVGRDLPARLEHEMLRML